MVALLSGQRYTSAGMTAPGLTNVTAHASANTLGTFVELSAATPFAARGLLFYANNANGAGDFLISIAIGASLDQVIIANLPAAIGTLAKMHAVFIPLQIPAGVRLGAAIQATTGSRVLTVGVQLVAGGALAPHGLQRATTYGANTADSGGTSIDPGAVGNTKGAWASLGTTTAPIKHLILGIGNQNNQARTTAFWLVDVGMGANPNQVTIIHDTPLYVTTNGDNIEDSLYGFDVDIPTDRELWVRGSCSITDATDRLFDAILTGVG